MYEVFLSLFSTFSAVLAYKDFFKNKLLFLYSQKNCKDATQVFIYYTSSFIFCDVNLLHHCDTFFKAEKPTLLRQC